MGKQGPCYHCGVSSTPLWRNGPPEKPVLCNACGSRWRTKGTLANYTPLHARAEAEENEDGRVEKVKSISLNKKKETRKIIQRAPPEFNKVVVDEDGSNRSSSGSAISNAESCAQIASAEGSESAGPGQCNVWDMSVPCKRRTWVGRPKASSVEKLRKDLCSILQEQQSSGFSSSSEEQLLFDSKAQMVSVEIGHGSVLMRHSHSFPREEDSEASSLSFDNIFSVFDESSVSVKSISSGAEKGPNFGGKAVQQLKRTEPKILGSHAPLLCSVDLKDVFNFDEFMARFTDDEQQELMKLLPQIDSLKLPDSLRCMFESGEFKENLSLFQKLVTDGVFEISSSSEDCKILKKLAFSDPTKSRLDQSYYQLKEGKNETTGSCTLTTRIPNQNPSNNHLSLKRLCESPNKDVSEKKMKSSEETKEKVFGYEEGKWSGEEEEEELLLDVPSNGSFRQAELLPQSYIRQD